MAADKTFINGVFAKKKGENFWGLWIPKMDEFIHELQQLPTDEKGGVNLNFSAQKTAPEKGSLYLDDWKPNPQQRGRSTAAPQRQSKPAPAEDDSDLPF